MVRIVRIDRKWRVLLPASIRRAAGVGRSTHVELRARPGVMEMRVLRSPAGKKEDPLMRMLDHPLHARKPLTKRQLEKAEEELWSS